MRGIFFFFFSTAFLACVPNTSISTKLYHSQINSGNFPVSSSWNVVPETFWNMFRKDPGNVTELRIFRNLFQIGRGKNFQKIFRWKLEPEFQWKPYYSISSKVLLLSTAEPNLQAIQNRWYSTFFPDLLSHANALTGPVEKDSYSGTGRQPCPQSS